MGWIGFQLTGKLIPQTINRLTQSVIVTSTGASNRIEGNRLNDEQVEALYRNRRIQRFRTRDEQEVAGYLQTLSFILDAYADMPHLTRKEMQELVAWYQWAEQSAFKHPLLRIGNFIFEYLAIHPFQDGNGRTSRLLTNLLLLQAGYRFTALASHEKHIEVRKADYYLALNKTQTSWKTDHEDLYPWMSYFLSIVQAQANEAFNIIQQDQSEYLLSEKQLALWQWVQIHSEPTFTRKAAITALGFPARTVEACIKKLVELKRLERIGQGRGTRYRVVGGMTWRA